MNGFQQGISAPAGQVVDQPAVMDYEGSQYETDFWVGKGREYEDATERIALRRLIPPTGRRIAEIGAAFGRLVELYDGYEQIVLFDYSRSQLQTAAKRLGADRRFVFVAGNVYNIPLVTGVLDTLIMVRVMHHLADVPMALSELKRVLHTGSTAVIEYANKRNLKALLRWWTGRQTWSPWAKEPIEFVKLNFDFHPVWMSQQLSENGFTVKQQYAVSHLRIPGLKNFVSPMKLAMADSWLYELGGNYPISPSVFTQLQASGAVSQREFSTAPDEVSKLFRCTNCGAETLNHVLEDVLQCEKCSSKYTRKLGVWDFKEFEPNA